MDIFIVSPGFLYTKSYPFDIRGSESVLYGISKELVARGHNVYIAGRFDYFSGEEIRIIDGINFINIKSTCLNDRMICEIGSILLFSKAVAKKIAKINPDVLCLNERFSAYFPSQLSIPKTFTTHNPDAMFFFKDYAITNNKLNYLFFDIKRNIEEQVMARSDAIIALNNNIKDYLIKCGFRKVKVIPNAIDVNKYYNESDHNFILSAGRLNKIKGISYLIKAYSELCEDYTTDLFVIGSGPEESSLRRYAVSNNLTGRVHFIPMVDKPTLREYLSRCKIFVLPSLFECMPVTLLEAMSSSKPVIAANIPGPNDIITQGYNGLLFNRGNLSELKRNIELCIQDKGFSERLGDNARKTMEANYSYQKVAEQYLRLFTRLVRDYG